MSNSVTITREEFAKAANATIDFLKSQNIVTSNTLFSAYLSDVLFEDVKVDMVEVVRCKDCKHWGSTISQADREQCASQGVDLVCNYWETDGIYAEDFCSYGERKETEDGNN